ncbi:phosphoinositide 3-kinase regulatory subunit 5 [Rhineura floridana]|uniref:phosphoinositide 3-kinase regulatory subunit 5 n=1 Tax=Rhineura floridana TaxID=261503 RepID=UPI002AC804DA|nr:phosphoinositide 3-kinase regulatory subunit 5 [Rhineura floridana]XP_061472490.1 phosphoinositide 3-kinase regulatory subunit 5 [Rhineura floridana]XP_061472491.1 phosphoinositide 3-kinase regulatory subunit 5 [Rhineura floridana]XP_061472492.1 phosphoinositide 3-kinase regulatory subunit 5 [Rhineura floridana]
MQHTTCTEDRIHHALERCLHGLSRSTFSTSTWTAGLCLNCWSLQELVSRDAGNYLILLEKILQKTHEVQEKCNYDLFVPLALLFSSALVCIPHLPSDSDFLLRAMRTYRDFLTWPVPYCNICRELLTFISNELKAPGISYQRLVRAEQGLPAKSCESSTVTVLLLNPSEVDGEFISVAEKLSTAEHSQHMVLVTLLEHIYQANFGTKCDLKSLRQVLKMKPLEELMEIFTSSTEAQEMAALTSNDPSTAREQLESALLEIAEAAGLPEITGEAQPCKLQLIPIPVARCYTYRWDTDNFDILNEVLDKEGDFPKPVVLEDEEEEEADSCSLERASLLSSLASVSKDSVYSELLEDSPRDSRVSVISTVSKDSELSLASKKSLKSFVSSLKDCMDSGYVEDSDESSLEPMGCLDPKEEKVSPRHRHRLSNKIMKLFKSKSQLILGRDLRDVSEIASLSLPLRRAESLCNPVAKDRIPTRSRRAHSLPQQALSTTLLQNRMPQNACVQRRPFLSCDEDTKISTLRVVVFGSDRISGKVARAYSNLKSQESSCPWLTRYFRLQFYYVPVKRSGPTPFALTYPPPSPGDPPSRACGTMDPSLTGMESSTNDLSIYIGMLDPWYERNVLGLMNLSTNVLCQQSAKPESEPLEETAEQLPILADMILYYCRFATRPVLLQVYQTEFTFIGGGTRTEIFIHSLELGHSAAIRAIKASGPGSKRLGIDGDREAIPLTLQIAYSKRAVSGRSCWNDMEKVCTTINLSKTCKKQEELDLKTECLTLTATEVIKRQSSKSKKSFNQQISVSQMKVDKVQIIGVNCSFAVCLDQDERKILQSVTRCEVSACYKPKISEPCIRERPSSFLPSQDSSDFCSLLCLPIATFSGALP